jgi:DNA-binding LytR/AlgR family response regulator
MNIVIIEDEKLLAEELQHYITGARKDWTVIKNIQSVKEGIAYLSTHHNYQLIFSDIQLGDGLSFNIFQQVTVNAPIIFCTAYNEYAIEAFKNNAIDYLLKPFNKKAIEATIAHYESLKEKFQQPTDYQKIIQLLQQPKTVATSLLVNHRDKIIPVKMEDIALFYIQNSWVHIIDFNKNTYLLNQPLDELETMAGNSFYRTDRQHLVNRKAIKDVSQYFGRRLLLNMTVDYAEHITIRKEKTTEFLQWLAGN